MAPKAVHRAGFHPTAALGALAAAGAVAAALGLPAAQIVAALGIAGSMASGIIEYLAEGTWTKRMHAGWAAQSGLRAALMARAGFTGPRTLLEGTHGFFRAFAPSVAPDFEPLLAGLGERWVLPDIAFKPYACGTMTQPYIDCAIALAARGVGAEDIAAIVCEVGEGTVHRLWEPLAVKQRAAQRRTRASSARPICVAVGFLDGRAGFAQFTAARLADPAVLRLAGKIGYVIDPDNAYPRNFTGHLRATLTRRPGDRAASATHARRRAQPAAGGGAGSEVLDNASYGGWDAARAEALRAWTARVLADPAPIDLGRFRG